MPFCSNCGKKIDANAKFCPWCGKKIILSSLNNVAGNIKKSNSLNSEKRRTVFEGEIRKCPNCGEIIDTFNARCPSCGFELNNKKVNEVLQNFVNEINVCEKNIENSCPMVKKTGWTSWGTGKKVGWVIINILFACIPLAIYLAIPLLTIQLTPKLTKEEKRMASLIENFPFPNDRESILNALVFAKEKIDYISKENIDRKNAYWIRLWRTQAEHMKQKADMLFPNDPIVCDSYNEIIADEEHVNKILKVKMIAGVTLLLVAIILYGIRNININRETYYDKEDIDCSATLEWQEGELYDQIPKPKMNNGTIASESEKDIKIELYNVTKGDFNTYVNECRKTGFNVNITKTPTVFYADNEQGYDLSIYYDDKQKVMSIYVDSYNLVEESSSEDEGEN